jgi:hypothetical protein
MMAVPSISEFLLRFPEFGEQSTPLVTRALTEAERYASSTSWGTTQFDAVSYLAAHILASRTMQIGQQIGMITGSPNGEQLNSSLYGQEYQRLRNSLPLSGFAL